MHFQHQLTFDDIIGSAEALSVLDDHAPSVVVDIHEVCDITDSLFRYGGVS